MALAQMIPDVGGTVSTFDMSEDGWSQIKNTSELISFGLNVFVTIVLTAAIVFHPVRLRSRRTLDDLLMPRLFFLYALIGMAVGFLVIEHGYIIGFVVFGIGALLRFRSNLDDPVDTVEMILVTVLGLAVGLNLPVMAILLTSVGWVFIWLGGRRAGVEVSLKAISEEAVLETSTRIDAAMSGRGWALIHRHHVPGKASLTALYQVSGKAPDHEVESVVMQAISEEIEYKIKF